MLDAFELLILELATTTLKTALPEREDASTDTFLFTLPAVKLVLALPSASVVAEAAETLPPFAVVTEKLTVIPSTGVPLLLVTMTSRGVAAAALGATT